MSDLEHLARESWDAFNSQDWERWIAYVHPDFEGLSALVESEGGGSYRGLAGAREWWDNLRETYETVEIIPEQVTVFEQHILLVARARWVGRGSGVELSQPVLFVCEVRDGLFVYVRSHLEPAGAFAEMAERIRQGASSPSQ